MLVYRYSPAYHSHQTWFSNNFPSSSSLLFPTDWFIQTSFHFSLEEKRRSSLCATSQSIDPVRKSCQRESSSSSPSLSFKCYTNIHKFPSFQAPIIFLFSFNRGRTKDGLELLLLLRCSSSNPKRRRRKINASKSIGRSQFSRMCSAHICSPFMRVCVLLRCFQGTDHEAKKKHLYT